MIIVGYPGIGKSTLAHIVYEVIDLDVYEVIDLESSLFRNLPGNWYELYVSLAEHLSEQGKTVFVSSHGDVVNELIGSNEKVFLVYPSLDIEEDWIHKIGERLLKGPSMKNFRAYKRVVDMFEDDIKWLRGIDLPKAEIDDMNYKLVDIVKDLEKRMRS